MTSANVAAEKLSIVLIARDEVPPSLSQSAASSVNRGSGRGQDLRPLVRTWRCALDVGHSAFQSSLSVPFRGMLGPRVDNLQSRMADSLHLPVELIAAYALLSSTTSNHE
jgi:hypothetical protein